MFPYLDLLYIYIIDLLERRIDKENIQQIILQIHHSVCGASSCRVEETNVRHGLPVSYLDSLNKTGQPGNEIIQ